MHPCTDWIGQYITMLATIPLATQMTNEVAVITLESLETGEADMRVVRYEQIMSKC